MTNSNNNSVVDNLIFESNSLSQPMRCKNCNNSIFQIHRENIINTNTNITEKRELVGICCECFSTTICKEMRSIYTDENNFTLIKFSDWQLNALESVLKLQKEAMKDIIEKNGKGESFFSDNKNKKKQQECQKQLENIKRLEGILQQIEEPSEKAED
jgi:hypothetical protein